MSEMKKQTSEHWTAEQFNTAVRLMFEGLSNEEIGEQVGKSAGAVKAKFIRDGIKRHISSRWEKEEEEIAVRLANEGFTNLEIALRLGREENAVAQKFNRIGFKRDEKTLNKLKNLRYIEFTPEQIKQMKKDYHSSLCMSEIAKKYGVSDLKIRAIAREQGWQKKKRGRNINYEERIIPFPELHKAYFDDCMPLMEILRKFNCGERVFYRSMERHGLQTVSNIHERRKMRAEAIEYHGNTKTRKTIHEMREAIEH